MGYWDTIQQQYNARPISVVSATKAFVSDKIYHIFFPKEVVNLLAKKQKRWLKYKN